MGCVGGKISSEKDHHSTPSQSCENLGVKNDTTSSAPVSNENPICSEELKHAARESVNSGIAFEILMGDGETRPRPKRLSARLEPIDGPRLTAEDLEERMRIAERKRKSELESRAKTASQSRRLSKRKRELVIAQELERQHQQSKELEAKLLSAEKQREAHQQLVIEKQRLKDERLRRARVKRANMNDEDLSQLADVEKDDHYNNEDVDSWLEGSNNETVDTGFSSAASERVSSGRESPKKRMSTNNARIGSSVLTSASTVNSCETLFYKRTGMQLHGQSTTTTETDDQFFDT